jgi:O-antigen ligase
VNLLDFANDTHREDLIILGPMKNKMIALTTGALFFLAAGVFTSVTILSAYQVLFSIGLAYFTWSAFKDKNIKLPNSAYWLLAFAFIALISTALNYELIPRPSKNFGRLKYFLYGALGIYVFRYWLPEASDKVKKILANTFFLSMMVAASYAFYQFLFSGEARASGLTETMRYGYGSGMILLTLLSALLHRSRMGTWFNPLLGLVAFIFGFMGMYLTYTRGALLGFLCGLPFVLYFFNRKLGLWLGGLAFVGVLSLGGLYLFGSGNYESRFLQNKNNASDIIRRSQWQAAIIATKERPILGWGLSNFSSQLKRIKHQYDLDAKDYDDAHSHNLFLEIASGTGLVGLFFFLGWLISWARESFISTPLIRALIVPLGVAFVVSSQFEVTFDANNASMIFFLYALSSASKEK